MCLGCSQPWYAPVQVRVLIGATERLVAATAGRCDELSADDLAIAARPEVPSEHPRSLAAAHVPPPAPEAHPPARGCPLGPRSARAAARVPAREALAPAPKAADLHRLCVGQRRCPS